MSEPMTEVPKGVVNEFVRRWTDRGTINRVGGQLRVREVEALRHLLYCLGVEDDILERWADAWQNSPYIAPDTLSPADLATEALSISQDLRTPWREIGK